MQPRLNALKIVPEGYEAMRGLQAHVNGCGLEHSLLELVKIRASQINGCAFCLAMHTQEARAKGETDARMHLLAAWREAPIFSPRERAALAWTEAVTLVAGTHVPDDVYDEARAHFTETELVNLTWAIITINGWNRMQVAFRAVPAMPAASAAA